MTPHRFWPSDSRPSSVRDEKCSDWLIGFLGHDCSTGQQLNGSYPLSVEMRAALSIGNIAYTASAGSNGTASINVATPRTIEFGNSGAGWTVGARILATGVITPEL
jgi:hypothetical protein